MPGDAEPRSDSSDGLADSREGIEKLTAAWRWRNAKQRGLRERGPRSLQPVHCPLTQWRSFLVACAAPPSALVAPMGG